MLIIGESLNAAIPSVGETIAARDGQTVAALARRQVDCGAEMLDVNAGGLAGRDEADDLAWLVETVQGAVSVPLVLDSNNPAALAAALRVYRGPQPILSSIDGEPERVECLLPLAAEHGCKLVALCMDRHGIPPTAEGRLAIARDLIARAAAAGIASSDLYVDPLVMAVSADAHAGEVTLATLRLLRAEFPQVRTICGASNVGFGLPLRRLINRTFVAILVAAGLEAFIVDVRDQEIVNTLYAARVVTGQDDFCRRYLRAYRGGKLGGGKGAGS